MRPLILTLCLLSCSLPLAAADAPMCVPRVIDDQNLACVGVARDEKAICISESLNPPAPFTYQNSYTCAPLRCPPAICSAELPPARTQVVLP